MAMSPADRQIEAKEDVERIERAFHRAYQEIHGTPIEFDAGPVLTALLVADVIRVGAKPEVVRPIEGQLGFVDGHGNLTDGE